MIYAAVSGTRRGRPDLEHWLQRFVAKYGPTTFISGDDIGDYARGVDKLMPLVCAWNGWTCIPHRVVPVLGNPYMYWERNQRMADALQAADVGMRHCICLPDDDSKGTWDCAERCELLGAVVHVCPLWDGDVVRRYARPAVSGRVMGERPWKR